MTAATTSVRSVWAAVPSGLRRWMLGVGGAVAVAAIVMTQNGNEVRDYLQEQGFDQISNVEVAGRIAQINVDVDSTSARYATDVCEALRGRFTDDDGRQYAVYVFYEPYGSIVGTPSQRCHSSG